MRNLFILVLIAIALFLWSRSRQSATQTATSSTTQLNVRDSAGGGPVRQWEREPANMAARESALPQPGSGVAPGAVLNTVRNGLAGSGNQ
ncbi:MAG TPA: hypothetical protein VMW17_06105 [Candidatus Binatia bacterium]|nr:hypothetical protein [Candidatus Binatia bacterium]